MVKYDRSVPLIWMAIFISLWSISAIWFFSFWISSILDLPLGPIAFLSDPANVMHTGNISWSPSAYEAEPFQLYMPNAPRCTEIETNDVSFTLAIQLSEDRLWMVKHHCERWGSHPMSIAIHTKRTPRGITHDLVRMGCSQKHLIVNCLYDDGDYPINKLRNLAINSIQTTHCLYIDVDFWLSKHLHHVLAMQSVRETLVEDKKLALVIPAFQILRKGPGCEDLDSDECDELNVARMADDRISLYKLIRSGDANIFDPTNPGGHHSTDYRSWLAEERLDALRDIDCIQSNRYEPYLVFRFCGEIPPFQERFTGYGKNKLTWAMQMRRVGYIFKVVAGGFALHFPHTESGSRKSWNERPSEMDLFMKANETNGVDWTIYKRGQIDALYLEFKSWLRDKTVDKSRVPMCYESTDDDSNLWVNP